MNGSMNNSSISFNQCSRSSVKFISVFLFLIFLRFIYQQIDNDNDFKSIKVSENNIMLSSEGKLERRGEAISGMNRISKEYESLCGKIWQSSDCNRYMPRLVEYCNMNEPHGEEDSRDTFNNYELVHLLIAIRHGDRTTLNRIPGAAPMIQTLKYNPAQEFLENIDKNHLNMMSSLRIVYQPSDNVTSYNPLDRSNLLTTPDSNLITGELTSSGFLQHYRLGNYLHQLYSPFLETIASPSQLYVRSTNYNRTIQVRYLLTNKLYLFYNTFIIIIVRGLIPVKVYSKAYS
jgi:hypothetical protein